MTSKSNNEKSILNESTSEISIETTYRDTDSQRVYRIFLVCWFLHAIIGILTIIIDFKDRHDNKYAYFYVVIMTFKWLLTAIMTFMFSFILFIIFRLIKPKVKSNFEEYAGIMYSILSSLVIVLAIPFGFKAIYSSQNIQFMTLFYILIEIVLDVVIC